MKKVFVLGIFLFVIFNFPVFGQDRYATCDQCGYCMDSTVPTNWENCRTCLYESASTDPTSNETLKIDDENIPVTPMPGRWYVLGTCVKTAGGFQQEGAASSLVQVLLNLIFKTAGGIAFIYFIYGSFIVLTSQSEPEKINHGKRIITGAIVGLVIALGSVFLVNLLASGFLKIPGFNGS